MSQVRATIVVVDDDPDIVECLSDYLGGMGFDVVSCRVGSRAAACIALHAPDLVILDVDLGDTTGVEVFHAVRADSTPRLVPVIFFTGNEDKLRRQLPHYRSLDAALVVKPDIAGLGALTHDLLHQQA